jgi:hypothetical protein
MAGNSSLILSRPFAKAKIEKINVASLRYFHFISLDFTILVPSLQGGCGLI